MLRDQIYFVKLFPNTPSQFSITFCHQRAPPSLPPRPPIIFTRTKIQLGGKSSLGYMQTHFYPLLSILTHYWVFYKILQYKGGGGTPSGYSFIGPGLEGGGEDMVHLELNYRVKLLKYQNYFFVKLSWHRVHHFPCCIQACTVPWNKVHFCV